VKALVSRDLKGAAMWARTGRAVAALLVGTTLAGCWVQRGFDAGRTNMNGSETELRSDTVHQLTTVWDGYTFGTGVNAPITVDGVVYVTTDSGRAAAFDSDSGAVRWQRNFYDGRIGTAPVLGDPAWHAGQLLVPAMLSGQGGLLRLDPVDGSTVAGDLTGEPMASIAVADDEVATMTGTAMPSGLGIAHVSWKFEPGIAFAPSARAGSDFAIVGERVMWSQGTQALGFSAACPPYPEGWPVTGCAPDWSTDLGGQPTSPAAVGVDGVVYADDSGTVTVLDAATGDVRWTGEAGAPVVQKAPAVAGDDVLVATEDGRLVAFASTGCAAPTCAPLWEATLAAHPVAAPVVGGDVVYVATSDGTIAAFDVDGCGTDTCSPLATIWVAGGVTGGPIVHDGLLIAGTSNGHVVAMGLPVSG
jgi:outer membrane protein assembly factor BamB